MLRTTKSHWQLRTRQTLTSKPIRLIQVWERFMKMCGGSGNDPACATVLFRFSIATCQNSHRFLAGAVDAFNVQVSKTDWALNVAWLHALPKEPQNSSYLRGIARCSSWKLGAVLVPIAAGASSVRIASDYFDTYFHGYPHAIPGVSIACRDIHICLYVILQLEYTHIMYTFEILDANILHEDFKMISYHNTCYIMLYK